MQRRARVLAVLCFSFVTACEGKSPPAPQHEEPGPATPAAVDEHAAAGEHAACIYAEGQKDEPEKVAAAPAPSCGSHEPDPPKDRKDGHFGAPFTLTASTPLAQAIAATPVPTEADAGPVLVRGVVEAVCQKKGCWMVIKDETVQARVLMKDHGFAVPIDSRGKAAVVEGTLATHTFGEAQVQHLEQDAGRDPKGVTGSRTEHVLTATGIHIEG